MSDRKEKDHNPFTDYKRLVKKCGKQIPLFAICTILYGFAFFLIFSSVGVLLTRIVEAASGTAEEGTLYNMAAYLLFVIVFSVCASFAAVGFVKIEEHVQSMLRMEMLESYLRASEKTAERYAPSEVLNRMNYDLQETVKLTGNYISGWIFQPLLSGILSVVWLFSVNWAVALLCIGCSAINMVIMQLAADRLKQLNFAVTKGKSSILTLLQDCVGGMEELHTFHLFPLFQRKLREKLMQTAEVTGQYRRLEGLRWSVMSFFADCVSVIALLIVGAILASKSVIAFPSIMLGVPLVGQIGEGMIAVSNFSVIVKQFSPNVERVFEIIDLPPEETFHQGTSHNKTFHDETSHDETFRNEITASTKERVPAPLRVEHIQFSYGEKKVLDDISFQAEPGEKIAFVGESGGGKSTVAKLLLGLYTPEGGEISIGNERQSDVPLCSWRKNFAYLPQDGYLFHDTVEANITLGAEEKAGSENVILAARKAFAEEFISENQQGLQLMAGGADAGFSGGQIQRLCMARALFRKAPVLLMDEPTASLDAQSEQNIKNTLAQIEDERIVIVITHRLQLTTDFDRIYVLENGRIVESGDHRKLLQQNGKYKILWENSLMDGGENT